ncbi:MAG: sigma-54-dependent transcriptional regulator [Gemmatimonadales bacterium]
MTSPAGHARILLVDDDVTELDRCEASLRGLTGIEIVSEKKSRDAVMLLAAESFDLLITDLRMPAVDGIDLLRTAHSHNPELPVLILTGYPSVDTAVETLKLGAADYLTKPVNTEELVTVVRRLLDAQRLRGEHRLLERHMDRGYAFDEIVGTSPPMQQVFHTIRKLSESDVDVLVVGETGTGKELVARSIHRNSSGRKGRFVPVDCAAIPEHLVESELFGHERGAFSGAHARSIGLMEFADGGTLFLDEVHALSPALQAKLLRTLQERAFRRVGSTREIAVDIRVIAAANCDPATLLSSGRLREDLYYRVNVGRVELPPLRERGGDVTLLTSYFVEHLGRQTGRPAPDISADALEVLAAYQWPGNVRELQNTIKRTLAMMQGDILTADELPEEIVAAAGEDRGGGRAFFELRSQHMAAFEREYLEGLLREHRGDVAEAAVQAQLPRGTLYRLIKKHHLSPSEFRTGH